MNRVHFSLGPSGMALSLPDGTDIYTMSAPEALPDPGKAVREALAAPIDCRPLGELAREALRTAAGTGREASACILVSDNTRPVPYRGEAGILLPVIQVLLDGGFRARNILVLVAAGTHRAMTEAELEAMIDPGVFSLGVEVAGHDSRNRAELVSLGTTRRGTEVLVNRRYVGADLRILTGLVESHFMAGASGGRKSICPGIIGERSTFVFHGAPMMAHPGTRDLLLEGNPCHEEALEVAGMAGGADFIVNVTLDHTFRLTGVFAGDLRTAHEAAVLKVKSYVGIPVDGEYDIVVTHGGYVGLNHYQAAKAGVASLGALRQGGHLIMAADNRDSAGPVGSLTYRTTLQLLKLLGPEAFTNLILSPDWTFIPEQWQTQMWAKLFSRIPFDHFHYFAPQLDDRHWADLPGIDGRLYLPSGRKEAPSLADAQAFIDGAVAAARNCYPPRKRGSLRIACLADGPYGIPYPR